MSRKKRMEDIQIWKLLGLNCMQSVFSLLVYQIYAFCDTWVVARGVGPVASAGIGLLSPVFILIGGISGALGTGGAAALSRALGAKEEKKAGGIVIHTMGAFFLLMLGFTILGELFLSEFLKALGAEDELYDAALAYGRILIAGAMTSSGFSGLMRAAGDLGYATFQWLVPIFVNLAMDFFFVFVYKMGVEGAAWATLTAQVFSVLSSCYYFCLYKGKCYQIVRSNFSINPIVLKDILTVGCPELLRQLGGSLNGALYQKIILYAGGIGVYTSFVFTDRILQLLWIPQTGIAQGMLPLAGFFSGKNGGKRKAQVITTAVLFSLGYGIFSLIICELFFSRMFHFFSPDLALLRESEKIISIIRWVFPIKGLTGLCFTYLQAEGQGGKAWILTGLSVYLIPISCMVLGQFLWGITGLWISFILTEVLSLLSVVWICIHKRSERRN